MRIYRNLIILFLFCIVIQGCGPKRHFAISKVKSAAKLATTQTTIDKLVVGTKTKTLLKLVKISEANFVASTRAYVKTGIDLERLKASDVKTDGKMIDINLPPVEVLDFSYPFKDFKIDSTVTSNAFLNRMDIVDIEEFFRKAELDIRENLQYTGVIKQTEKNTARLMRSMLKNIGYTEIYIRFKKSDRLFPELKLGQEVDGD